MSNVLELAVSIASETNHQGELKECIINALMFAYGHTDNDDFYKLAKLVREKMTTEIDRITF